MPAYKLTPEKVPEVRRLIEQGVPDEEIANQYGVQSKQIQRIRTGRSWSQVKAIGPPILIQTGNMNAQEVEKYQVLKIKQAYGMNPFKPVHTATTITTEGETKVMTDDEILWIQDGPARYFEELKRSGINEPPVFSDQIRNLPFEPVYELVNEWEDSPLQVEEDYGSCVMYGNGKVQRFLKREHHEVVRRHGLEVFSLHRTDFRVKILLDDFPIAVASTLIPEEENVIPMQINVNEQVVAQRERSDLDMKKLEAIDMLLSVVASEDIDSVFLSVASAMKARGYNLAGSPEMLLARIKDEGTRD